LKKVLCILVAAVLALTACGGENEVGGAYPQQVETLEQSKLVAALEILAGETFTFEMGHDDEKLLVKRDGNSLYVNGFGNEFLLVEQVLYLFDHESMKCYYQEIGDDELQATLKQYSGLKEMVPIEQGELSATGTAEFMGEILAYEEVTFSEGGVTRAFFEGGTLVGLEKDDTAMKFTVLEDVPSGTFDVPEGFEMVDFVEITG
jgi:hypothetical protein